MHLKTLGIREHNQQQWEVRFHSEFDREFVELPEAVRKRIVALGLLLKQRGPELGRPTVDTLKGSKFANMKELRFLEGGGAWRVAFAFDLKRRAIVLVAGNKSGISQGKFYRNLIEVADRRFEQHQSAIAREGGAS